MRITLNLPDALAAEAKSRAASEGMTFASYIEEALRDHLVRKPLPEPHEPLPTFTPRTPGTLVDLDDKDALRNLPDERE